MFDNAARLVTILPQYQGNIALILDRYWGNVVFVIFIISHNIMTKFDMLLPQDKVNYCSKTDFEVHKENLGIVLVYILWIYSH